MKTQLSKSSLFVVSMFFLFHSNLLHANEQPTANSEPPVTAWVKLISNIPSERPYTISTNYLESSIINCGSNCQLIKLSSTPFSNKGELTIHFPSPQYCPADELTVAIPFVAKENQLNTLAQTSKFYLPCGNPFKVIVSEVSDSTIQYKIEFIKEW